MDNSSNSKRQRSAAATPGAFAPLEQLPEDVRHRITSYLPIEGVEALAQVSTTMHQTTRPAREQIKTSGLTGRARVAGRYFYTKQAPSEDTRLYFPTSVSGTQADFPHITRRSRADLAPHLSDVATIHHAAMPNSLPPGNYPTRHRYDVDLHTRRLSAPVLPTNAETRRTGTYAALDPKFGPDMYVAPRYKARVEAGDTTVPASGQAMRLTRAQSTVGMNPQNWTGQTLHFDRRR